MSTDSTKKEISTQEQRSNGGKNRAKNLSPERRKEIAILASHSRKCTKNIPKVTHMGKIDFGNVEIACAVLDNGKSVITETSIFKLFGMQRGGRKKTGAGQMPRFLSAKNLQEYIPDHLMGGPESFNIYIPKSGKAYVYEAEKIPDILKIYLDARRDNKLTPSQIPLALTAEIIMMALAKTGIVALIHEVTGFQKQREVDELQKLFSAFIATELQPWVKRFPTEFFSHLKRMYGLDEMKRTPSFIGHLINRWIYRELSPEIHEELKRLNPVGIEGHRKHSHHQFLTQEIGCPALTKQIQKVVTLMSISDNRDDFEKFLEKSKM